MPKYNYVALDAHGKESKGTIEVASQNEAISRVTAPGASFVCSVLNTKWPVSEA